MHSSKLIRAVLVTVVVGAGLVMAPQVAMADPPPSSAIDVTPTALQPGETFTVTQTIYNDRDFTIVGAKAALYGKEKSLVEVADLVSCTGTIAPCGALGSSYRGGFGDLPSGESRTVVFTLKVKDTATSGQLTLQHQFVGDNYAFETLDGPAITVVADETDLAVSLTAVARGLLASRITYTITVRNTGQPTASNIRVTAAYPAGLVYAGSPNCTRVGNTRTVTCDIASLAGGASATRTFSVDASLLAVGALTTSATRTQSAPADPNAANDRASKTCTALTGLLVRC
jgi:uncharacterized repeat protein (TIGR01451 family)